jgi:arylsulfatase A-like enzyme
MLGVRSGRELTRRPAAGSPRARRLPRAARRARATTIALCVLAGAVTVAALPGHGSGAIASPGPMPNIIVIVADDQRTGTITPEIMPNVIQLLQSQGTTFTNAYVSTPLCCPSRSSMFTGRFAHNHQVLTNQDALKLDQTKTMQRYLHQAGYRTGIFGKFLNVWVGLSLGTPPDFTKQPRNPPDFDQWAIFDNGAYYPSSPAPQCPSPPQELGVDCVNEEGTLKQLAAGTYATTYVKNQAEQFIRDAHTLNDAQPWFLWVSPTAPHAGQGGTFDKTKVVETKYQGSDTVIPPFTPNDGYNEQDLTDKPPYVRNGDAAAKRAAAVTNRDSQLRMLKSLDDLVQGVFTTMDTYGETSNTLAVYISDNGFLWGEHGLGSKGTPYTEAIKVPLIVRFPPTVGAGVDTRFAYNIDITATALAAAGVSPPAGSPPLDGKSLLDPAWTRDHILTEGFRPCFASANPPPPCSPPSSIFPTWSSIVTPSYQYIRYYDDPNTTADEGFDEYYDMINDPSQLTNLYGGDGIPDPGDPTPPSAMLDADRLCSGHGPPGLDPPPCP